MLKVTQAVGFAAARAAKASQPISGFLNANLDKLHATSKDAKELIQIACIFIYWSVIIKLHFYHEIWGRLKPPLAHTVSINIWTFMHQNAHQSIHIFLGKGKQHYSTDFSRLYHMFVGVHYLEVHCVALFPDHSTSKQGVYTTSSFLVGLTQ